MKKAIETDRGWFWTGIVGWPARFFRPADTKDLGRWGEWLALCHLRRLGWDIVTRNWSCKKGEVDLIAYDRGQLVVVEVKTRKQERPGPPPEERFDDKKLRRLEHLAVDFLRRYELSDCPVRFDLIAVETADLRTFELRHTIL